MKLIIKTFISICIIGLMILLCYTFGFLPVVFESEEHGMDFSKIEKDKKFNPLDSIDINNNCEIYLVYSFDDYHSQNKLLQGKVYSCSDKSVIEKMRDHFNFKYTGSDLSTTTSKIYILENGKIKFSSGLVLEKTVFGLQSKKFGWVKNDKLIPFCHFFKRIKRPFVIL